MHVYIFGIVYILCIENGRPVTIKRPVQKLSPLEVVTNDEQLLDESEGPDEQLLSMRT